MNSLRYYGIIKRENTPSSDTDDDDSSSTPRERPPSCGVYAGLTNDNDDALPVERSTTNTNLDDDESDDSEENSLEDEKIMIPTNEYFKQARQQAAYAVQRIPPSAAAAAGASPSQFRPKKIVIADRPHTCRMCIILGYDAQFPDNELKLKHVHAHLSESASFLSIDDDALPPIEETLITKCFPSYAALKAASANGITVKTSRLLLPKKGALKNASSELLAFQNDYGPMTVHASRDVPVGANQNVITTTPKMGGIVKMPNNQIVIRVKPSNATTATPGGDSETGITYSPPSQEESPQQQLLQLQQQPMSALSMALNAVPIRDPKPKKLPADYERARKHKEKAMQELIYVHNNKSEQTNFRLEPGGVWPLFHVYGYKYRLSRAYGNGKCELRCSSGVGCKGKAVVELEGLWPYVVRPTAGHNHRPLPDTATVGKSKTALKEDGVKTKLHTKAAASASTSAHLKKKIKKAQKDVSKKNAKGVPREATTTKNKRK